MSRDRGFVDVGRDKLSQLSKELFFSFRFVCNGDLEIWICSVSIVTSKLKLGGCCFFWNGSTISGAPLASFNSFFIVDVKSQFDWGRSADVDSSLYCRSGCSPLDHIKIKFDGDQITIVICSKNIQQLSLGCHCFLPTLLL